MRAALSFAVFCLAATVAGSRGAGDEVLARPGVGLAAAVQHSLGTQNKTAPTHSSAAQATHQVVAGGREVENKKHLVDENSWKNDLVLWMLPADVRSRLPRVAQTWFRCWVMCMALYFGVGCLWAYYAYFAFGDKLFKQGQIPVFKDMWEQMKVSFIGMPLYAMLPTLTEFCVEQGWTLAYGRVDDVGLPCYTLYFVLYMISVEFFVYWQHRILHMGVGYKWLHFIHHKYNKGDQMSPFAGLAFHPLDGIMQALPYSWTLFYVPMHFLTHEMLLFFTSIWTTNIHDNVHAKIAPVMGAGYHTIHHTLYNYNYGHYFTFVDRLFGTLITPEELEEKKAADAAAAAAAKAQ